VSQQLIGRYLNELSDLRRVSGEVRESVVREAFKTLIKDWGRSKKLIFVPEYRLDTATRDRRFVDGALLHELRVPFGYWEAKDEDDDLDAEIQKKFRRGYPQDNIVFEDSREAVLIQDRQEVMRCSVDDPDRLEKLLGLFFSHERPEIADFRKAVAQFKSDLPAVLEALRAMIERAEAENPAFHAAAVRFLKHAQETINPSVTAADVREMLIQHILTEEIFSHVFDNADFHRQNNVARELYRLEETFFTGAVKHQTLEGLRSYYAAIRSAAALVSSHHEKQTFLKVVYENFYKIYNPKAADRLGVVYTPSEIVRFMVESADWLCQHHFGKQLIDRNVEILDPAAGTGTFIAELIEHFHGQPAKLKYKYREELHANEVAILPYYVANLNIEATYAALTGEYEEYPNLCFVDTLDNIAGLRQRGRQGDFLGALSDENVARINRQNSRKISVIIGNPPYNANQLNENENNKNRTYPAIDQRIKETYIAASSARKTKQYDMFVRFFRWASDRIDTNGITAFITNRSFIDKYNFDGFRKTVPTEFSELYIIDLGGDWKTPGIGGGGNVFGIATGVAISFFVKKERSPRSGTIRYFSVPHSSADDKLAWLSSQKISDLKMPVVEPDQYGYWTAQSAIFQLTELPVASKSAKATKIASQAQAIFRTFSLGISTNRDEWLYDVDRAALDRKARGLIALYDTIADSTKEYPNIIKWSRNLKRRLSQKRREPFSASYLVRAMYRPFVSFGFINRHCLSMR
jgi:predicted helicase